MAVRNEEASNTEHGSANDILIAETKRMWRAPVTGWPDVVARANAARYWKWPRFDGNEARKYETLVREADDLDDGPLALLIHASLTIEEAHSPRVPAAPQEAPISDLRIRLRKAIARYDKALAVAAKTMGPEFKRAEAEQVAAGEEIAALEAEIPHPPRCYEDLYARAEVARHGGDVVDGKLMEAEDEEDVFLGPAGRLIEAVVHMGGRRS